MKEKLTRNISLKILSIILAAILWLVITNIDNPIKHKTYYNVSVDILNEDDIKALNQVYTIVSNKTIDFTFAGRRSIVDSLTVADFKVTADLSKLSDVNAVSINISCPRYQDEITITYGMNEVMKVELEELVTKGFNVNVVQKGEPAEGYYVNQKTTNTIIYVSGPKSKIDNIKSIVTEVDVSNMTGNFKTEAKPRAKDEDGKEIDASNLSFSQDTVTINIGMYRTKTIDVSVETTGKPATGYLVTGIDFQPTTIEIAAEYDVLRELKELVITESIDGAIGNIEKEINLKESLDSGVYLVGDNDSMVLNITIEKAETKEVTIWPGDIEVRNKSELLQLAYVTTGPITIKLAGLKEEIDTITRDTIEPFIDLTGYTGGTYMLTIGFDLKGSTTLVNKPTANIQLIP